MPLRLILLCLTALGTASISSAQDAKPSPAVVRENLLGSWRLVSIETIAADGSVTYPFYGRHPEGLIMYDRSGWMSVQIVSDPKPSAPATNSRAAFVAAPAAEKIAAAEGYYAYCGTWRFDASASTVVHHIVDSLYPGERGEDFARHVELQNDRLTLIAKVHEMGEDHRRKLVWERLHADNP